MTYRDMSETTRITYLRSEIVVSNTIYQAAMQIYCTRLAAGQVNVTDTNQEAVMNQCIKVALEMAVQTERVMNS